MINKRVKKDYGMSDFYKYYCKEKEQPISALKFNKIVSEFNYELRNLIIESNLEYRHSKLQITFCIRKIKKVPKIENGKLVNTSPIDWKSTKELWLNNKEAAEKKILLKFTNNHTFKYIFRIKGLKHGLIYKNKKYYKFKPARSFQRLLAKRILDPTLENFDAYKLY